MVFRLRLFAVAIVFVVGALQLPAATRTWSGSSGTLWSDAGNWGGVAPAPGDDVVFPSGAGNVTNTNDFAPGTLFNSITVSGQGYNISGNAIALGAGGINADSPFIVGLISDQLNFSSITLAVSQTWSGIAHAERMVLGPLNVNGKTLTLNGGTFTFQSLTGTGSIVQNGDGTAGISASSYNGTLAVHAGLLSIFSGTAGDSQVDGGTLTLSKASTGNVTVTGSGTLGLDVTSTTSASHTGDLRFISAPGDPAQLSLTGSVVNIVAANVTGSVTLANAKLVLNTGGPPPSGSVLTIINNDGTDAVAGTFLGLPEGAILNSGGVSSRISYTGGTGNDVTKTVLPNAVPDTTTVVLSSASTSLPGQNVTLTATVSATAAVPPGTVNFYDGTLLLGSVPLNSSGQAALTVPFASGSHLITAAYLGSPLFAVSQATVQQTVLDASAIPALGSAALLFLAFALGSAALMVSRRT